MNNKFLKLAHMKHTFLMLAGAVLLASCTHYPGPDDKAARLSACIEQEPTDGVCDSCYSAIYGPDTTAGTNTTTTDPAKAKAPKVVKSVQCKGITKAGARCKHQTFNTSGYCYQHQAQDTIK